MDTDVGKCRFQGRTDTWEGANVGTDVVRHWFPGPFGPWAWAPTRYHGSTGKSCFTFFLSQELPPVTRQGKSPREPPNRL
eukprot:11656155-Karenia_brevis.AAC.1